MTAPGATEDALFIEGRPHRAAICRHSYAAVLLAWCLHLGFEVL